MILKDVTNNRFPYTQRLFWNIQITLNLPEREDNTFKAESGPRYLKHSKYKSKSQYLAWVIGNLAKSRLSGLYVCSRIKAKLSVTFDEN